MSGQYSCNQCDLVFDSKKSQNAHVIFAHKTTSPTIKKVLILGGGFGGIGVLKELQRRVLKEEVSITLVNEENYFLFTPMLPEMAAGMIHPSNIAIPIRKFCKTAKFYQAVVSDINLNEKLVTITRTFDGKVHALEYDYLVLALGSKNNFFGNKNIEDNCFTIKSIEDGISLKNHTITMMESAAQTGDEDLQKRLLTFAVVGGGFAGVETIGELNHFIRQSVKHAYPTIDPKNITPILISARGGILPEVGEKLGSVAMKYLKKVGVNIITNTKAVDATEAEIKLDNGGTIPCSTIIWAGGVAIDPVISSINCEHENGGRIKVNKFLQNPCNPNVFALGDCAAIKDEKSGKYYPPTAQHAIRESKIVAKNILESLNGGTKFQEFSYKSKGMMATIGNRVGVVSIFGRNLSGVSAWAIWRAYYLANLPTFEKKLKVATDWTIDLLFERDLTLVGKIKKKELQQFHLGAEMPSLKEQLFADL